MKTAIELVSEERERQKTVEGWTGEHDDQHKNGELASAGATYLSGRNLRIYEGVLGGGPGFDFAPRIHSLWPWEEKWLKLTPQDRIRELVKGCALGLAEIERLQRLKQDA